MLARALVPLKDLDTAKSRLSDLLSPTVRRGLAQAMAEDVLSILAAHPGIGDVILVSDDPRAHTLAIKYGVRHWTERSLGCRGLNHVIEKSCARLFRESHHPVVVLHGDLPCLVSDDISAVLDGLGSDGALVVACDRHERGTNLLAFGPQNTIDFAFGADSYSRHCASAKKRGIATQLLYRAGIALDIDEPDDLALLMAQIDLGLGGHCARYLTDTVPDIAPFSHVAKLETNSAPAKAGISVANEKWQTHDWPAIRQTLRGGGVLSDKQALALANCDDTAVLAKMASSLRDRGHNKLITYSRKVFIPLTQLCRDVCHYCTFAQTPKKLDQVFMPVEDVLELCRAGAKMGCQEALFTLGERPELRYSAARNALAEMGYTTTLEYVQAVAARVLKETGLLPHINAGCMSAQEIAGLRRVSVSMGIMLESASSRLCEKGMPHYGSPDKDPQRRLHTLELAGRAQVPFTSGILIGIGETRLERIESLLALRKVHERHGHLQEIIVQNFRAKPHTLMAQAPEPDLNELLWTIAVSRLIFGPQMSIQAPPNLSPGVLPQLIGAGINDWGGVSPLTPDHVNPEAPWPHLDTLARETASAGKFLEQRLTLYPAYALACKRWLDPLLRGAVMRQMDGSGYARRDNWAPGEEQPAPEVEVQLLKGVFPSQIISMGLRDIVVRCEQGDAITEADLVCLFESRGADFAFVTQRADALRKQVVGEQVSYVVTRNINYTNVCGYKCQFCAFSKGSGTEDLRGRPYDIDAQEIARRTREAWQRGATEVCMQGGIHPDYTGNTYLDILRTVKSAVPDIHIHAFSPLEVWQGAQTLGVDFADYFGQLQAAGLGTLPGTAAEILHDEVRSELCPDKLNSAQWLEIMAAAHRAGLKTTATIMYGHIDEPRHWASHLMRIRELQQLTAGFTEFVPLPFVHMEAPMYRRGKSRKGPSFREAILMHAVARLAFHGLIDNIQCSWVKMGEQGVRACLNAGANDLGGTLMNESITRAAGTWHGQEWSPEMMENQIRAAGRAPRMRDTLYRDVSAQRYRASFVSTGLIDVINLKACKYQTNKRLLPGAMQVLPPSLALVAAPDHQVTLLAACN